MPRPHSTTSTLVEKPAKPDGSPLYPHPSGKWAKKIKGKLRYFGRWEDHEAALAEYERLREAYETGKPAAIRP